MDNVYYPHRRGLAGPLILIALGVGFLLSNLGVLPNNFWDAAVKFWPVILIILGLDGLYRGDGWIGSIFFTGLGIVFLLSTLGYLSMDIWTIILRYWPLLIVVWGLDILLGRGRQGALWRAMLGLAILIVMVAGIIWFGRLSEPAGQAGRPQQIQQSLGDARQISLNVTALVSNLNLQSGAAPNQIIQGTIRHAGSDQIKTDYHLENSTASYSIRNEGVVVTPFTTNGSYETWDLNVNPIVNTDLKVDLVIGSQDIDLANTQIQKIDISTVIGNETIQLPTSNELTGSVSGVIGQTTIRVPQGTAVRFHLSSGLNNVTLPTNYVREGEYVYSPGAKSSGVWADIKVEQVIGKINIEEQR